MINSLTHNLVAIVLTLSFAAVTGAQVAPATGPDVPTPTMQKTPDGIEYGTWGEAPADKPAPVLVVLSGNTVDSISKRSFLRAGRYLGLRGYLCISIDIPNHGPLAEKGKSGLVGWGKRAAEGDDFVAEFNARMKKVLDHLIEQKKIDPAKIVVTGTSRGGFLAMQYGAFDPRVKAIVAYAPATNLRKVTEFEVAKDNAAAEPFLNVEPHIDQLVGRPLLVMIGDRDERVDTDTVIAFMRKLAAAAVKKNVPGEAELLVLSEPRGHSLPPTVDATAARWIYRVIEGKEMPE